MSLKRKKGSIGSSGSSSEKASWFWVNRGGFPLDDVTYSRLWRHVCKIHPKGLALATGIRDSTMLPEPPFVSPPNFQKGQSTESKVEAVQSYLNSLQYNHTGTQFFDIRKEKSINNMVGDAKLMMKECLPIKCLEAVILSIYLTHPLEDLDRFTIGFKTKLGNTVHKHVVLGITCNGLFGAVGLSRREELMHKPLLFHSLGDLLGEFISCYQTLLHQVKRITLSQFLPHSILSFESIYWKCTAIDCENLSMADLRKEAERHVRKIRINGVVIPSPKKTAMPGISKNNKVANGNLTARALESVKINVKTKNPINLSDSFGGV